MLPSARRLPAMSAMPVSVPVVSKKSRKNSTNTVDRKANVPSIEKSSANAAFATGGLDATPPNSPRPVTQPMTLRPRIVNRMPPRTPRASRPAITSSPASDNSTGALEREPRVTSVNSSSTTSPMPCSPIIARNSPIPAVIPARSWPGIAPISQLRSREREKIRNRTDATNTAARACCQLNS